MKRDEFIEALSRHHLVHVSDLAVRHEPGQRFFAIMSNGPATVDKANLATFKAEYGRLPWIDWHAGDIGVYEFDHGLPKQSVWYDRIMGTLKALENYAVLDESKWSEMEHDQLNEDWNYWIASDFRDELAKRAELPEEMMDEYDDEMLRPLFDAMCESSNTYPEEESEGGFYIRLTELLYKSNPDLLVEHLVDKASDETLANIVRNIVKGSAATLAHKAAVHRYTSISISHLRRLYGERYASAGIVVNASAAQGEPAAYVKDGKNEAFCLTIPHLSTESWIDLTHVPTGRFVRRFYPTDVGFAAQLLLYCAGLEPMFVHFTDSPSAQSDVLMRLVMNWLESRGMTLYPEDEPIMEVARRRVIDAMIDLNVIVPVSGIIGELISHADVSSEFVANFIRQYAMLNTTITIGDTVVAFIYLSRKYGIVRAISLIDGEVHARVQFDDGEDRWVASNSIAFYLRPGGEQE